MPTLTLSQINILINALEQFKRERAARLLAEQRLQAAFGEAAQIAQGEDALVRDLAGQGIDAM